MSSTRTRAAPDGGLRFTDTIPPFAELAADPEIAPLLDFEPVVRKIRRPDGWTPELQRELIARLAATGTVQQAVWQMNKHATGAEALYKVPSADAFRAAWDAAIAIGRRRNGLDCPPPYQGDVPGITRRRKRGQQHDDWGDEDDTEEMAEEDKLRLIGALFFKWLGKVEQEREARLTGEVVAADFYLRQVTVVEVMFDLMCENFGMDPWQMMNDLRRGDTHITQIAATPMSQILDTKRRELWAKMGEPERPEFPPARYLIPKVNFSVASEHAALSDEEKQLPPKEQERLFRVRREEEVAAQLDWERSQTTASASSSRT